MRFGGLIAAVIFAAIAAIVVMRMSETTPQPVTAAGDPAVRATKIYVATVAIPVGSAITAEMIAPQDWPENLVLPGFIKVGADNGAVVGMVARAAFQQNEPIIDSKITNPNDPNFLAGSLPAGMRVITLPVNEIDGVAGFVFPGDHVDLLYTHEIDVWETPPAAAAGGSAQAQKAKKSITETLLTDVKVLAVDQRASNAGSVTKEGALVIPKSASLMVSPADAQRVRLAQKTGMVSLSLRAIADKGVADKRILTQPSDISQSGGGSAGAGDIIEGEVRIVRGAPRTAKESLTVTPLFMPQHTATPITPAPVLP